MSKLATEPLRQGRGEQGSFRGISLNLCGHVGAYMKKQEDMCEILGALMKFGRNIGGTLCMTCLECLEFGEMHRKCLECLECL